jgi:hypothetical protein
MASVLDVIHASLSSATPTQTASESEQESKLENWRKDDDDSHCASRDACPETSDASFSGFGVYV